MKWKSWHCEPPEEGTKVALLCDDGCSTFAGLVVKSELVTDALGFLEGEEGFEVSRQTLDGAVWIPLPDWYALAFMERTNDP